MTNEMMRLPSNWLNLANEIIQQILLERGKA